MTTQLKMQLSAAGIDITRISTDAFAILETMNADELKAFVSAQQKNTDQPTAYSSSFRHHPKTKPE